MRRQLVPYRLVMMSSVVDFCRTGAAIVGMFCRFIGGIAYALSAMLSPYYERK